MPMISATTRLEFVESGLPYPMSKSHVETYWLELESLTMIELRFGQSYGKVSTDEGGRMV